MAVELATAYISLVPSAKGLTAGIEKEMGGPLVAAGQASGAKSSATFGAAFKKGIKAAAPAAAIVAGLVAIGSSFEGAFNTIARGTGATGKTLEGLNDSFRNVLKSGSGSFDQVSQAITVLNQRTGLTGKTLEDFAAKEVTLARITKTDVGANLQATTGLFNLFGVAAVKQSASLDVLFRASQVAGVSITQLADEMQAAAPTAKILGLNLGQTAALVANLDKAGLPASKVMAGLGAAFAKAAKQGKAPLDVIHDLVTQIKAAPSPTAAAAIAVQKFGISSRTAAQLVEGLRSGAIDLNASLDGGKGILATAAATSTLSGKFGHLKNVALVGLEPLATQALDAILKGVEFLTPAIEFLTDHMNVLGPIILSVSGAFAAFKLVIGIQDIIDEVAGAFDKLVGVLFVSTGAAAAEAAAMTGVAAATTEATAASAGFALTPVGAAALVAAVAIGALIAKLTLFSHSQKDAGTATNSFIASLLDEGKALSDVAGQVLVKAIRDHKQLGETFKAIDVPLSTVNKALLGNKEAILAVGKAGVIGVRTGKISIDQYGQLTNFIIKNSRSLHDNADAHNRGKAAAKDLASAESGTAGAAKSAALAQDQLRIAATNMTTSIINSVDRLRGLQEGLVGVLQSAINLRNGLRDLRDKQKALTEAQNKYGKSSREASAAADDLAATQLSQIGNTDAAIDGAVKQAAAQSHLTDHLKAQADAQANLSKVQADAKSTAEDVAAAQDNLDRATKSVSDSQKIQNEVLQRLADRVKGPLHVALLQYLRDTQAPKPIVTPVTLPGLSKAQSAIARYLVQLGFIPKDKVTKFTLEAAEALHKLGLLKEAVRAINPDVSLVAVARGEGGRASGGNVKAGSIHLVGEKGPEFVQFTADAHVFPHGQIPLNKLGKELGRGGLPIGPITTKVDGTGRLAALLQELFDEHDRELTMALGAGAR